MNKCPECKGEEYSIDSKTGECICKKCGLVIENSPFETPYINEIIKERADTPCLATVGTKAVGGKVIKKSWLFSTKEKNLRDIKDRLELISSQLNLCDKVRKDAFFFFKQAVDKKLNRGRGNFNLLCASIYASCLLHKTPKTTKEIIYYTHITKKKLLKSYSILKKGLNLDIEMVNPEDFIPRFSSILKLKQSTITKAYEIINKLQGSSVISGKLPKTISASALYLATKLNNDPRTQREIANATEVIETTIRKRSRELAEVLRV